MNHALDAVGGDHALDQIFIGGVADEQRHAFGQECGKSGGQIVDHHDAFAGFHQRLNHVTSNVAGAAGDKHGHELTHLRFSGSDAIRAAVKSGFRRKLNWSLCLMLRIGNAPNGA